MTKLIAYASIDAYGMDSGISVMSHDENTNAADVIADYAGPVSADGQDQMDEDAADKVLADLGFEVARRDVSTSTCLNCGAQAARCEDEDCWHRGQVEPYVHAETASHYCNPDADSNMCAEVERA